MTKSFLLVLCTWAGLLAFFIITVDKLMTAQVRKPVQIVQADTMRYFYIVVKYSTPESSGTYCYAKKYPGMVPYQKIIMDVIMEERGATSAVPIFIMEFKDSIDFKAFKGTFKFP